MSLQCHEVMHCASSALQYNVPKGSALTSKSVIHPALKFLLQSYEPYLILPKEGDGGGGGGGGSGGRGGEEGGEDGDEKNNNNKQHHQESKIFLGKDSIKVV